MDERSTEIDMASPQHGIAYPLPFGEFALELVKNATRSIKIICPALDPQVFDSADMASAISAIARRDGHSRVEILIADSGPIVRRGHRLLNLARRLPSSISIRKLTEHPEMIGQTLLIKDSNGVLFMPDDDSPGYYQPDSRSATAPLIDSFHSLWERGTPDPEFRHIGL